MDLDHSSLFCRIGAGTAPTPRTPAVVGAVAPGAIRLGGARSPAAAMLVAVLVEGLVFARRVLDHAFVGRREGMRVVIIALGSGCIYVARFTPLLFVLVHGVLGLGSGEGVSPAVAVMVMGARRLTTVVNMFLIVVGRAVGDGVASREASLIVSDQANMLAHLSELKGCESKCQHFTPSFPLYLGWNVTYCPCPRERPGNGRTICRSFGPS